MSSDRSPLAVAGVEMGSMLAVYEAQDLSHLLHYIAPAATLCYYLIATAVSVLTMQNLKIVNQKVPHKLLLLLMASVSVSYMIEATMLLIDTFTKNALWSSTDTNVSRNPPQLDCFSTAPCFTAYLTTALGLRLVECPRVDDAYCRTEGELLYLVPVLRIVAPFFYHRGYPPCSRADSRRVSQCILLHPSRHPDQPRSGSSAASYSLIYHDQKAQR